MNRSILTRSLEEVKPTALFAACKFHPGIIYGRGLVSSGTPISIHSVVPASMQLVPLPVPVAVWGNIHPDASLSSHSLTKWDHSESMPEAKDKYSVWIFSQSQCAVKSGTCFSFNSQVRAKWHNCGSTLPEIEARTCTPALSFTACVNVWHFLKSTLLTAPRLTTHFHLKSNVDFSFHSLGVGGHSDTLGNGQM